MAQANSQFSREYMVADQKVQTGLSRDEPI